MDIETRKVLEFACERMGDKPITEVVGISDNLGAKLAAEGFDKVTILMHDTQIFLKKFFPSAIVSAMVDQMADGGCFPYTPFHTPA